MAKAIDQEDSLRFLKTEKLESRDYQESIANQCAEVNSLVVIPTGLGKTIISLLVMAKVLESYPDGSKVIVLAPTRPLIAQHQSSFQDFLNIPPEKMHLLTGNTPAEKRPRIFAKSQILFFTPQTLRNDLVAGRYGLKKVCLIIFDEAHHASGDYPYRYISDVFNENNPDGIILGLTASPGSSKEKIGTLCEVLHIKKQNVHVRTRNDEDVRYYIKPIDIYKIGVKMTDLMEDARSLTHQLIEERLQYLSHFAFLDKSGENLIKKVMRKDLVKLNTDLVKKLSSAGKHSNVYGAISVNAQALIMYHILELIEQQGLDALLLYLEKLFSAASKKNSSKANRILVSDRRLRRMRLELKKYDYECPEKLTHPKLHILEELLVEKLVKEPNSRILVFVKLRDSVLNIVNYFKNNHVIKAQRFVGQATKSKRDKGISQANQLRILEEFKEGIHNVLIATNVAEEGLDIAECDVVVFYDIVASEIRYIQRKGRTARKREGKVILLYTKNTNDEIYLRIALSKINRMNSHLKKNKGGKSLQSFIPKELALPQESPQNSNSTESVQNETPGQPTLHSFIGPQYGSDNKKDKNTIKKPDKPVDARVSTDFPGKFGVRKLFREENVKFEITGIGKEIYYLDKVKLILLNPRDDLLDFQSQPDQVIIIVHDFEDFQEEFEGEKRLLKQKLANLSLPSGITTICIDLPEELAFILKSMISHHHQEEVTA